MDGEREALLAVGWQRGNHKRLALEVIDLSQSSVAACPLECFL